MPSKKLKSLKAKYKRQNGLCYWCGAKMIHPWEVRQLAWLQKKLRRSQRRLPDNACTLDHLHSRMNPLRGTADGESINVAACRKCNHERGKREQAALQIEELRRRSGRWPGGAGDGQGRGRQVAGPSLTNNRDERMRGVGAGGEMVDAEVLEALPDGCEFESRPAHQNNRGA